MDMKKRNGEFVYGTAPYGYKKGAERNTIIIDDEAAVIDGILLTTSLRSPMGPIIVDLTKIKQPRRKSNKMDSKEFGRY